MAYDPAYVNYRDGIRPNMQRLINRAARHNRGRKITAKRPDQCEECFQQIGVGESVYWSSGAPPVHEACFLRLENERAEQEHREYVAGQLEDAEDRRAAGF